MLSNLAEGQVVKIWQHQLLDGIGLVTEDGEAIEIVSPGRINDDQGPDFRGAVIATGRGLIKGDIEIHVKSSGWREHQHHQNVVYNRVILHVVMWHNAKTATYLQNGGEVPVLALHKYIKIPIDRLSTLVSSPTTLNMPCLKAAQRLTKGTMAGFLDRTGEKRFLAKAARFQTNLAQMGAGQSLYQGIMSALGYSKNKIPFLELARRLPLKTLESMTKGEVSDRGYLVRQQALLLGTAGLLPSQREDGHQRNGLDDKWVDKLERLWASSHHTEAMPSTAWHLFKIRPNNSPIRRLVAMSYLMLRYRRKGILEELISLVKEVPVSGGYCRLEEGLVVTSNDYWVSRLNFGSGSRIRSPTLLGRERAADIVVNILLPFTFAWGQFTSQPELERKTFNTYHCYPKVAVNSVERHMTAQLGLSNDLVNSAQRQQGLIHIYNSLCTQGKCNSCPFKQNTPFIYDEWQCTGFQPAS